MIDMGYDAETTAFKAHRTAFKRAVAQGIRGADGLTAAERMILKALDDKGYALITGKPFAGYVLPKGVPRWDWEQEDAA